MNFSGALCVGQDLSLFYPTKGNQSPAVKTCAECPAKDECLDHGLKHEEFGIWGGTSPLQRKKMRKTLGIELIDPMTLLIRVPDHPFCGTENGYQRAHRRARKGYPSVKCIACRDAHRTRVNERRESA